MIAWPMPDMQKQVDAVREAFSADTRKPFVLKPSFPYSSPRTGARPSPQRLQADFRTTPAHGGSLDRHLNEHSVPQHSQVTYSGHPVSPPISTAPGEIKSDASAVQAMMAAGQGTQASAIPHPMTLTGPPAWNPSRIFE